MELEWSASDILARLKAGLKNEDTRIEGSFSMDNMQAVSEELARYVVVWVTFFGISSCARYHTHVGVDLLSNFLKGRAKLVYQALICLISVGLSVYMTYISIGFTIMQYKGGNTSIAIAIPIWLIYLSTNIGFGLMSYVYLRNFMKLCSGFRTGKEGTEC